MAYASQGTVESVNISEPALRKAIQDRLNALENINKVLSVNSEYNPDTVTSKALAKMMSKYRTHLSDILSVYNMAKEKYMRQGKTLAELNQDEDFKRARGMYSATLAKLKEITKEYHKKEAIPATAQPVEGPGGQMSPEAEQEIQHQIGEAKVLLEAADETIILLNKRIEPMEAAIKLGMSISTEDEAKLEKLKQDLDTAIAERELHQQHLNSLTNEYEHRKT